MPFKITITYDTDRLDRGDDHRKIVQELKKGFPEIARPYVRLLKYSLTWTWEDDRKAP